MAEVATAPAAASAAEAPPSAGASSSAPSILPCETLWIANLPDKLKKGPLKDAMYRLYSTFGSIKGINVTKTKALRGQAWISFGDVAQAAAALRDTQNQLVFGKPIRVEYARAKSDAVLKAHNVPLHEQKQERAKRRSAAQDAAAGTAAKGSSSSSSGAGVGMKRKAPSSAGPSVKRQAVEGASGAPTAATGTIPVSSEPNRVLLASQLPADMGEPLVKALFGRFPGFAEVRMVQERGLAFVTYSSDAEATAALMALNGFRVTNVHTLSVGYAAK